MTEPVIDRLTPELRAQVEIEMGEQSKREFDERVYRQAVAEVQQELLSRELAKPAVRTPATALEKAVEFRVFKQTRTEDGVTTYEVVDRFAPKGERGHIIAIYDDETEAIEHRDRLRRSRLTQLELAPRDRAVR